MNRLPDEQQHHHGEDDRVCPAGSLAEERRDRPPSGDRGARRAGKPRGQDHDDPDEDERDRDLGQDRGADRDRGSGRGALRLVVDDRVGDRRHAGCCGPPPPATRRPRSRTRPTSSVRRRRPRASAIASTHRSGTRIENSSARWRIALPRSSTRLSLFDLNSVRLPALAGIFDVMLAGRPSRAATVVRIWLEVECHHPVVDRDRPLASVDDRDQQLVGAAIGRGPQRLDHRAFEVPRPPPSRRRSVARLRPDLPTAGAGAAAPSSAGRRHSRSRTADRRGSSRSRCGCRGSASSWVLVFAQLSGLNRSRLAHTERIVNSDSTVATTITPVDQPPPARG